MGITLDIKNIYTKKLKKSKMGYKSFSSRGIGWVFNVFTYIFS